MSGSPDGPKAPNKAVEDGREIYIEFLPLGNSVKVVAVDSVTGREVSIVGPVNAARRTLEQNAIRKLKYVMERDGSE